MLWSLFNFPEDIILPSGFQLLWTDNKTSASLVLCDPINTWEYD